MLIEGGSGECALLKACHRAGRTLSASGVFHSGLAIAETARHIVLEQPKFLYGRPVTSNKLRKSNLRMPVRGATKENQGLLIGYECWKNGEMFLGIFCLFASHTI
jgi:hypothetical protein